MRINRIDFLRFVGISSIILAHVNPPELLHQFRNFDVPLMVLISGSSFHYSRKKDISYKDYLLSRIPRLCLPVWIFLTFLFFIAYPLVGLFFGIDYPFDAKSIIASYLLLFGIGYVWVIRVFVLVALGAPFIRTINEKVEGDMAYFAIILVALLLYTLLLPWLLPYFAIQNTVLYLVPYACVFALGIRLEKIRKNRILPIALTSLTLCLILVASYVSTGQSIDLQDYKYPPQLYYLSYALFVSLVLYQVADPLLALCDRAKIKPLVIFIGQNSMWIYLWHILMVELKETFALNSYPYLLHYAVIYGTAVILTYLQVTGIHKFFKQWNTSEKKKKFLLSILTG